MGGSKYVHQVIGLNGIRNDLGDVFNRLMLCLANLLQQLDGSFQIIHQYPFLSASAFTWLTSIFPSGWFMLGNTVGFNPFASRFSTILATTAHMIVAAPRPEAGQIG